MPLLPFPPAEIFEALQQQQSQQHHANIINLESSEKPAAPMNLREELLWKMKQLKPANMFSHAENNKFGPLENDTEKMQATEIDPNLSMTDSIVWELKHKRPQLKAIPATERKAKALKQSDILVLFQEHAKKVASSSAALALATENIRERINPHYSNHLSMLRSEARKVNNAMCFHLVRPNGAVCTKAAIDQDIVSNESRKQFLSELLHASSNRMSLLNEVTTSDGGFYIVVKPQQNLTHKQSQAQAQRTQTKTTSTTWYQWLFGK